MRRNPVVLRSLILLVIGTVIVIVSALTDLPNRGPGEVAPPAAPVPHGSAAPHGTAEPHGTEGAPHTGP
jgi:hypothetical protein